MANLKVGGLSAEEFLASLPAQEKAQAARGGLPGMVGRTAPGRTHYRTESPAASAEAPTRSRR